MAKQPIIPLSYLRELMNPNFVNHKKIECIKYIRMMTGEGLREAKDFFEQEWMPLINGERPLTPEEPSEKTLQTLSDYPEFRTLAQQVRELSSQVDSLQRQLGQATVQNIFEEG